MKGVTRDSFTEANLTFTPLGVSLPATPLGQKLRGGPGDDELIGSAGPDTIRGGPGDDTLFGYAGDDHLDGQALSTTFEELFDSDLFEGGALQQIFGGAGNDTLENGLELYGGDGDDLLLTTGSIDLSVNGGRGQDTLVAIGDGHELIGGEGADEFRFLTEGPSAETNILDFEPGVDRLLFATGQGVDGRGDLSLRNVREGLEISDDAGGVTVLFDIKRFDFSFDDVVFGTVTPVEERDEPSIQPADDQPADPSAATVPEGLRLIGDDKDEFITGSSGNDTIEGRGGADHLDGGAGNDFIFGGDGNDFINGGAGNDSMFGNAGDDGFRFDETETNDVDSVFSFDIAADAPRFLKPRSGAKPL